MLIHLMLSLTWSVILWASLLVKFVPSVEEMTRVTTLNAVEAVEWQYILQSGQGLKQLPRQQQIDSEEMVLTHEVQ